MGRGVLPGYCFFLEEEGGIFFQMLVVVLILLRTSLELRSLHPAKFLVWLFFGGGEKSCGVATVAVVHAIVFCLSVLLRSLMATPPPASHPSSHHPTQPLLPAPPTPPPTPHLFHPSSLPTTSCGSADATSTPITLATIAQDAGRSVPWMHLPLFGMFAATTHYPCLWLAMT